MNESKAYRYAYYATRAVFRVFDRFTDSVLFGVDSTIKTVKDTGRGIKDAASNSILDVPAPRTTLVVDGHVIHKD